MPATEHDVDHQTGRHGPRRLRFSLRTFLILLTLLCVSLVWLSVQGNRVRHQKKLVAAILDLGGSVRYDWQPSAWEVDERRSKGELAAQAGRPTARYIDEPGGPEWLRNLIGQEPFQHIAEIQLAGSNVFTDRVDIRDQLLNEIASLRELEGLTLATTDISDADLQQIGKLTKLRYLCIINAPITDAGLVHLRSLEDLEELFLGETAVTEEGVEQLQAYLPDCRVEFSRSSFWE